MVWRLELLIEKGYVTNVANRQSRHQLGFDYLICHTPHQSVEDVLIHLNWHHPDLVQLCGERSTQDAEAEFEPRWNITNTSSRLRRHFQKVTTRKTAQLEEYRPVKIFKFMVSNFINPGMVRWEPNRSWVFKSGERFPRTALDYPINASRPWAVVLRVQNRVNAKVSALVTKS